MNPSELYNAITTGQDTLTKIDQFLHGSFVNFVTGIVNKYTAQQLEPFFQFAHSLDNDIQVKDLEDGYAEFQADLNNARQISLTKISNAGEWLKTHPLILRFVANHVTSGGIDEEALQQMREVISTDKSV